MKSFSGSAASYFPLAAHHGPCRPLSLLLVDIFALQLSPPSLPRRRSSSSVCPSVSLLLLFSSFFYGAVAALFLLAFTFSPGAGLGDGAAARVRTDAGERTPHAAASKHRSPVCLIQSTPPSLFIRARFPCVALSSVGACEFISNSTTVGH